MSVKEWKWIAYSINVPSVNRIRAFDDGGKGKFFIKLLT